MTAYPTGQARPVASNVNYAASETVANRVTVPLGTNGQVTLYSASPTDLVVDVSGWYTATGGGTGLEFTPEVSPVRICDTRGSNPSHLVSPSVQCNTNLSSGGPANPLIAGSARTIQASGLADVPSGASAAVLNVTDVAPTAPSYLTVYPQGNPPTTSDVNPPVGGVQANFTVATLAAAGSFNVVDRGSGTTNLVVDIAGWYSSSDSTTQSILNTALTDADAEAAQNNQQFVDTSEGQTNGSQLAVLQADEPSITFLFGTAVTTEGSVSVWFDESGGQGIVFEAYSNDGPTCWYAVDNLTALTITFPDGAYGDFSTPDGTPTSAPAGVGTYYASAPTIPAVGCNAEGVPLGATPFPWSTSGF